MNRASPPGPTMYGSTATGCGAVEDIPGKKDTGTIGGKAIPMPKAAGHTPPAATIGTEVTGTDLLNDLSPKRHQGELYQLQMLSGERYSDDRNTKEEGEHEMH